jgi:hypothetical protein
MRDIVYHHVLVGFADIEPRLDTLDFVVTSEVALTLQSDSYNM